MLTRRFLCYILIKIFVCKMSLEVMFVGGFFYRLNMRYSQFMQGRYGNDELNIFLLVSSLVFFVLSRSLPYLWFLYFVALILVLWCMFRTYSRNISGRYEEKMKFIRLKNRFLSWYGIRRDAWRNRKTHRYFRCKNCKASIRVPKGVGKIEVTCPKCRTKVIKKV